MHDIEKLAEHVIDKEIYVIQRIMKTLEYNKVSYIEWERLLPILSSLIDEQEGEKYIHYKGD